MKVETIDHLAYIIQEAKKRNRPKPIVFLGAGASRSAGIPDAKTIAQKIITDYPNNPKIKNLKDIDRTYAKLMDTLQPSERNELLKSLIDEAKINVTHVYLAQMMKLGFIDYFLTVNFDNLMQRALALYNIFPPTYDISILKDITTTSFHPQSVTYLHGQHNGLWLLNTKDEMDKVKEIVPPILNKISNGRIWIIIGYSGGDPIFDHIVNLGRFDDGLYWVGYKDNEPEHNVIVDLLDKSNTNAYLIKDYDADSFCLKLNTELGNPEPSIFDKPFNFLKESLNNIVDIEDTATYKSVKERLDDSKKMVEDAIHKYEVENEVPTEMSDEEITKNHLKKEIINAVIKNDFEKADDLYLKSIKYNDSEINNIIANLYNNWAVALEKTAVQSTGKQKIELFELSNSKLEKAANINGGSALIYSNWGVNLEKLSQLMDQEKKIIYFNLSCEKFENAILKYDRKIRVYINYSSILLKYSHELKGMERNKCLEKALLIAKKAHDLENGAYNLSCTHALLKDKSNALKLLKKAFSKDLVTKEFVLKDIDWKDYYEDQEFKKLLSEF